MPGRPLAAQPKTLGYYLSVSYTRHAVVEYDAVGTPHWSVRVTELADCPTGSGASYQAATVSLDKALRAYIEAKLETGGAWLSLC